MRSVIHLVIKCGFDYFANRKYSIDDVNSTYINNFLKEQKESQLPNGLKFIKEVIEEKFCLSDFDKYKETSSYYRVRVNELVERFKIEYGGKKTTLETQLRQIGILSSRKKLHGNRSTFIVYEIYPPKIKVEFQKYF